MLKKLVNLKFMSVVTVAVSLFIMHIKNKSYEELLDVNSCPFCYGTEFCKTFYRDEITVHDSSTLFKLETLVTNFLGINNVIFASFNDTDVVVKKLAHHWEFNDFDKMLERKNTIMEFEKDEIFNDIKRGLSTPFGKEVIKSIRLCPTVEKFDLLCKFLNNSLDKDSYLNLWFTFNINPEPIVQKFQFFIYSDDGGSTETRVSRNKIKVTQFKKKILPSEDGWPVPKFFGGCGRTVISQYSGDSLTDRIQDPWHLRSDIACQLLAAAFNFTYSHPLFAFYLTDIIPDNIAVSSDNKITFVDLENIIIVERNTTAMLEKWSEMHTSNNVDCDGCFAFSSDDICSHSLSDHNIYAVCREILSPHSYLIDGGLLHTPPESFLKRYPQFWTVLLNCVQPPDEHSRFYYAKKLLKILK